jgi:exonuclease VII large subunit
VPYSLLEEERREREVEARERRFMDEQRRREVEAQKKREEDERVRAHFEKRKEEERRRDEDDRRRRNEVKRREEEEQRRAENMRNAEKRRREERDRREKEEREKKEKAKDLLELSSMARVLPNPFAASTSASWFSTGSTSATPSASRYSAVAVEDQKRKNPFLMVISFCMGFLVLSESVDSIL